VIRNEISTSQWVEKHFVQWLAPGEDMVATAGMIHFRYGFVPDIEPLGDHEDLYALR
jgi:hypothetical protein